MKTHVLPDWLRRLLMRSVAHRYYSLVVTAIAFGSTITFSFPFVAVLIPAVLLSPRRWRTLGLLCGLASGSAPPFWSRSSSTWDRSLSSRATPN
jgi:hypothetical protein